MTSNSQIMSAAIGLSLFLACIPTDNANAEDGQTLRAENFFAMADLFGGLSFSPGETITISSPDADVFRDFVVPGVDGRLRLGIQSTFLDKNHLKQTVQEQAMRKVDERMGLASYEYLGLLALQHTGEITSDKSLLYADRTLRKPKFTRFGLFTPRGFVALLASNLLQHGSFNRYFCNNDPVCEAEYRQLYRLGAKLQLTRARAWGRNADEFVSQAALEAFLGGDMATMVAWSESLSHDVALVGLTELPKYDVEQGGFALRLDMIRNSGPKTSDFSYTYIWRSKAALSLSSEDHFSVSAFLPMDSAVARDLSEELASRRAHYPNGLLYYVLQGKMLGLGKDFPELRTRQFELQYELTDASVSLYKDAALDQLIANVPLLTQ